MDSIQVPEGIVASLLKGEMLPGLERGPDRSPSDFQWNGNSFKAKKEAEMLSFPEIVGEIW